MVLTLIEIFERKKFLILQWVVLHIISKYEPDISFPFSNIEKFRTIEDQVLLPISILVLQLYQRTDICASIHCSNEKMLNTVDDTK